MFYLILFIILCGYVFLFTKIIHYSSLYSDDTSLITARIISYTIDGDKLSLVLKGKEKIKANYFISSDSEKVYLENTLKIGQLLEIMGEKSLITANTIPNTFNYESYLYYQRIYFCFLISDLRIIDNNISFYDNLKNGIYNRIENLNDDAYLKAFILGDKSGLEIDEYQNIVNNGISHLFALSGMHLSLVYVFLSKLFKKFKLKKIIIYNLLFLYLTISGFSISFLRAILFMLLIDLNSYFKLGISNLKVLFLTFSLLLLYEPFYLYNVGFWYTFIVTFSLLLNHDLLENRGFFTKLFLVSIITFLFSIPITIYMNYEINIFSIINNLFFVPYISFFVFPLAIFTFIFSIFMPIFQFLINILNGMNEFCTNFAISIIVGKITLFDVFICYLLLILFFSFKLKRFLVLFFLFFIFLYNKNIFDFNYHVYYIDVGQGDSSLIITPQKKKVILIDTGGKMSYKKDEFQVRKKEYDLSKQLILFFKSLRIRKLDFLLITHGDYDHMGEAFDLVNNFKIDKVIFNNASYNDLEKELIDLLDKKKIKYYNNLNELNIDNNKIHFLNTKIYDNENDNSNVIFLNLNNYRFLFMGDAGVEKEKDILVEYNLKNIDFLKVGHHGSNTSSSKEFIDTINPRYSIISVGKNNRYGHPKDEVLKTLSNSKIYRTDINGSIEVVLSKKEYKIKSSI